MTTGTELSFTRVLPTDLAVGLHRIELVTDQLSIEITHGNARPVASTFGDQHQVYSIAAEIPRAIQYIG